MTDVRPTLPGVGRRQFLRLSTAALGVLATSAVLEACGGNAAPASSAAGAPTSSTAAAGGASGKPAAPAASGSTAAAASGAPAGSAKPAASGSAAPSAAAGAPAFKPEKPQIKISIPVEAPTFLPMYIAIDRTGKEQGLDIQLLSFRGDAESSQALAGDSVDVNLASMNGLINLITANQPVMGFYMGFYQVTFDWVANKSIKAWADLKGKSAGVSTYGSLTDFLTRFALTKHGLQPEKDVQMVQAGGNDTIYQAIKSGKLGMGILGAPQKWQAEDEGYTKLGSQDKEIAPEWPTHAYMAKTNWMNQNPNTLKALMRAHVNGIRLAKSNKDYGAKVLADRLKVTPAIGARMYDEVIGGYNEKGPPPEASMPTFWQIMVEGKFVDQPWPESKYLDRRLIDTFDQWAPK